MVLHRIFKLAVLTAFLAVIQVATLKATGRLDESLARLAAGFDHQDSLVDVLVILDCKQVEKSINRVAPLPDLSRGDRIKSVTARLKSIDVPGSQEIAGFLADHSVSKVRRHWIIPSFTARIPVSELNALTSLAGVDEVITDSKIELTTPVDVQAAPSGTSAVATGIQMLRVPALWQNSFTGKGRLVCSFDTGVERIHPALASKWRGNHASLHESWFSMVAPDSLPYDRAGHGTHTMGVMVGSTATDSIGVAPDAEWICAGIIDQGPDLSTTMSHILLAFQWALDPDGNPSTTDDVPDVILNSWGLPTLQPSSFAPCSTVFWQAIDNVEAAGIVTIFAAGNEGKSGAMTIRNPANRASTPYNSFCVGAVNDQKVIADFSSRGPSYCDTTQIKPEVVAPGVNIRSSYKGGTYVYMSGTSMAAPFIAGLVALCRQYNPDASVDQIKSAFLQASADLGSLGEDNDYGWGLVDASKLIQYLPVPSSVHLSVLQKEISGDGIALPGETVGLKIYLASAAANIDYVAGQLISLDDTAATVTSGTCGFLFGSGGTVAINSVPFQITFASSLVHGTQLPFKLRLTTSNGSIIDSVIFRITAGYAPPGSITTHHTGDLDFTVSEFGQFGLTAGSIYNVGGEGFRYKGSANLLYEAGLIIGRSAVQISNSVRDSMGNFRSSDFRPKATASAWIAEDGATHQNAVYSDNASPLPIPVTVAQESIHFREDIDNDYVILKFKIFNNSLEKLTGMYAGLLADFDLSNADSVYLQPQLDAMYQTGSSAGPAVGLVALSGGAFGSVLHNGARKVGMSLQQQYSLISSRSNQPDFGTRGDRMMVIHFGPFNIAPLDSAEFEVAFVAGSSVEEMLANSARARERSGAVTSIDESRNVPTSFVLNQNYPNPFNPSTVISFSLEKAAEVSLDVFNMLGQRVVTLHRGMLAAGKHTVTWDGTNASGSQAGAGVYLYRIATGSVSETRKMILLK